MRGLQYDDSYNQTLAQINVDGFDLSSIESKYYPSITSSIYQIEAESTSKGRAQTVTQDGRYSSNGYEVKLNQVVYDQELIDQSRSYDTKKQVLKNKLIIAQQDLMIEIADAYWSVKETQQVVYEEEARQQLYKVLYEQAKVHRKQGLASVNDFNQAESEMMEQNYQAELALNEFEFSVNELYQKTLFVYEESKQESAVELQCLALELPQSESESYLDIALTHNPELNLYRDELSAYRQERSAKKSAYWPKVNFSIDTSNSDQVGGSFDGSETQRTEAKLSVDWNIYLGGQRSIDVKKSVAQLAAQQRRIELFTPKLQRKLSLLLRQIKSRKSNLQAINISAKQRTSKYQRMMSEVVIGSTTKSDAMRVGVDVERLLSKNITACKSLILNQLELMKILGVLNAQLLMK
jgi:outer membrane protein TolC